jgi:hypothetical protein
MFFQLIFWLWLGEEVPVVEVEVVVGIGLELIFP